MHPPGLAGFESLLEASRCQELSMLYSFFVRFKEGQGLVCKAFGSFIKVSLKKWLIPVCPFVCPECLYSCMSSYCSLIGYEASFIVLGSNPIFSHTLCDPLDFFTPPPTVNSFSLLFPPSRSLGQPQ